MRLYVHGAGQSGPRNWPLADRHDALFTQRTGVGVEELVDEIGVMAPQQPCMVLAHSMGAVSAVLAMASGLVAVDRLVLVEPALYDIARGDSAVEHHIKVMTRARSVAAAGDLFGYWQIVRPLMFGGEADRLTWDEERPRAERFATQGVPWGHGVTGDTLDATPTLVVTGGWNAEYEAIAAVLARHGATHEVLTGSRHRPQDDPRFPGLVATFSSARWRTVKGGGVVS